MENYEQNLRTKTVTMLFLLIFGAVVIIAFIVKWVKMLATEYKETKAIRQEEQRLDWILEHINELYILNDEYATQWQELEAQQTQLHESAEQNREQINVLWNEYYKDKVDSWVMNKICELSPNSPMCWNYTMLNKLKEIADNRGVDYKLLLGIMRAESKLGTARAPTEDCKGSNNWWWVKARKYDDGSISEWFDKQENKIPWCWLYNFDTIEEFFESLANTISLWYAKCNWDVYCISRSYVGHESWAWVNNVFKFKAL